MFSLLGFYLNPKFQASSSFLCLYRPVCVGPVRKPYCWFSQEAAHIYDRFKAFSEEICPILNILVADDPVTAVALTSWIRHLLKRASSVQYREGLGREGVVKSLLRRGAGP